MGGEGGGGSGDGGGDGGEGDEEEKGPSVSWETEIINVDPTYSDTCWEKTKRGKRTDRPNHVDCRVASSQLKTMIFQNLFRINFVFDQGVFFHHSKHRFR